MANVEAGNWTPEVKERHDFWLPEEGKQRIEEYVDGIVTTQRDQLLDPRVLDALFEKDLNTRATVANLPEGVNEQDFAGQVMLSFKTESGTDLYIDPIYASAKKYDQPWLSRFGQLWYDDELSHNVPFKKKLLELGYSEEELDREQKETREAHFDYGYGYTPVEVTTFGDLQEYLTDNWYELLWKMERKSSPEAAAATAMIKRRETLHRIWYGRMSALQVEANPDNIVGVASAVLNFSLPGNIVAPDFQAKASGWMPKMGADVRYVQRQAAKHIADIAGNPERTGRLVVELAEQKGVKVGPVSPKLIRTALDRFGPAGYGLFGEAAMEKYVLAKPIPAETVPMKVRALIRGKIADAMPDIDLLAS